MPEIGTCVDRCAGVNCPQGRECNVYTGACQAPGCDRNTDCPRGNYCGVNDHQCHATGGGEGAAASACERDTDCAVGFVCDNVIIGSFCTAICDSSADCGGQNCQAGLLDPNRRTCSILPI